MLVVKVEIWPLGSRMAAREIGRLEISNVGGSEVACHYDVRASSDAVKCGDVIRRKGEVVHDRGDGPWVLVMKAIAAMLTKGG